MGYLKYVRKVGDSVHKRGRSTKRLLEMPGLSWRRNGYILILAAVRLSVRLCASRRRRICGRVCRIRLVGECDLFQLNFKLWLRYHRIPTDYDATPSTNGKGTGQDQMSFGWFSFPS